jgi:ABC-2 type transport system ATP-binding protein
MSANGWHRVDPDQGTGSIIEAGLARIPEANVQERSCDPVTARKVCKHYANTAALVDVDLVVSSGELHGLLGANGAGKTTLLRVLLGLVRPDAGTVHVFGRPLDPSGGPLPDGVAGFVETPGFYPYLSGRRNLDLLARLDGASAGRVTVAAALERVGLDAHAETPVAGYSAGMRQRLGLAAALMRSPRLLFLDEPTSSLDPGGARAVRALIRGLADEGVAVVLSSHDMNEVEELCATLTVLDRGRAVFAGAVDELRRFAPGIRHLLHTSDDTAALALAWQRPDLTVAVSPEHDGLEVAADTAALDQYVIALGRAGIAVRSLESRPPSLESLFLQLTAGNGAVAGTLPAGSGTGRSTVGR